MQAASMNQDQPQPSARPPNRLAHCPTCGRRVHFEYAGEQRWPSKVARIAGVKPVVQLWNCDSCHTTLSEQELQQ